MKNQLKQLNGSRASVTSNAAIKIIDYVYRKHSKQPIKTSYKLQWFHKTKIRATFCNLIRL